MDHGKDRRMECLRLSQEFEGFGTIAKVNARASAYFEFLKGRRFSRNSWDALVLAHTAMLQHERSPTGGKPSRPSAVTERAAGYLEFIERPFEDPVFDEPEAAKHREIHLVVTEKVPDASQEECEIPQEETCGEENCDEALPAVHADIPSD